MEAIKFQQCTKDLQAQVATIESVQETFLVEDNIKCLKRMFETSEDYKKHMRNLWLFRDLIYLKVEDEDNPATCPYFHLFDTINSLVGCLLQMDRGIHFDNNGRAYTYKDGQPLYI